MGSKPRVEAAAILGALLLTGAFGSTPARGAGWWEDCARLLRQKYEAVARVTTPVPGLYESIHPPARPGQEEYLLGLGSGLTLRAIERSERLPGGNGTRRIFDTDVYFSDPQARYAMDVDFSAWLAWYRAEMARASDGDFRRLPLNKRQEQVATLLGELRHGEATPMKIRETAHAIFATRTVRELTVEDADLILKTLERLHENPATLYPEIAGHPRERELAVALRAVLPTPREIMARPDLFGPRKLGGKVGEFAREVVAHAFHFAVADLRDRTSAGTVVPRWIRVPGTPDLVPGKGTPVQLYVTLLNMRQAGISYGTLKKAVIETVNNSRTSLELLLDPTIAAAARSGNMHHDSAFLDVLAEKFAATHTMGYVESALTQSGHRVKTTKVTEFKWKPFSDLENQRPKLRPEELAALDRVRARWCPSDPKDCLRLRVPMGFEIELELEPYSNRSSHAPDFGPAPTAKTSSSARGSQNRSSGPSDSA